MPVPSGAWDRMELGAVRSTLGDLQDWITTNVPGLRAARIRRTPQGPP